MKNKILIISLVVFSVYGCARDAEQVSKSTNPEFYVSKLFEFDGCTVYRFYDGGAYKYYTKCGGLSSSASWTESCGKGCSKEVSNATSYPTKRYTGLGSGNN